jgi:hypothetical protein
MAFLRLAYSERYQATTGGAEEQVDARPLRIVTRGQSKAAQAFEEVA